MFNFVEYLYANSVYFYRRSEGFGERLSASVATISYSLGLCIIVLNFVQLFTGSLAPFVRELIPAANKPYNNAAELFLAFPPALILHYCWLWRRTPALLSRYAQLKIRHQRWVVPAGFFFSVLFAIACGYGRVNFALSLAIVATLAGLQALTYRVFIRRLRITREA